MQVRYKSFPTRLFVSAASRWGNTVPLTVKDNPSRAVLFGFTLLSFSSLFISRAENERSAGVPDIWSGDSAQRFHLSAAIKSATVYTRLRGVFCACRLNNINSLARGGAHLLHIGPQAEGCVCPQSLLVLAVENPPGAPR